jgi:hypothetical protein
MATAADYYQAGLRELETYRWVEVSKLADYAEEHDDRPRAVGLLFVAKYHSWPVSARLSNEDDPRRPRLGWKWVAAAPAYLPAELGGPPEWAGAMLAHELPEGAFDLLPGEAQETHRRGGIERSKCYAAPLPQVLVMAADAVGLWLVAGGALG